jgi:hypothetical protein
LTGDSIVVSLFSSISDCSEKRSPNWEAYFSTG